MDYATLATPPVCVADFCLIPIGTPTASVSNEVAAVQRLMKASGMSYSMHSAGTTVEGPWDDVMRLIGQAHTLVHQIGVLRIQSDIRIGTRTDKKQHFSEKVSKVESILAADGSADQKVIVSDPEPDGKERIAKVGEETNSLTEQGL
ncbi:Extracellular mutant 15 [Hyphodiscus hymeniophilus]|uniref:Extracellular mutant 15 n=1 Tax=Hyphodiscus hymeniophilus TaxID=353542 RepID=A0A9P6VGU7_9HELO|nr:Extracellular mutant 15 [Hyphodiscus hymeniophilus]